MTSPSLEYREIPLTKGQVAIVDADNYDCLNKWSWHAHYVEGLRGFYAARGIIRSGKYFMILMHRQILGLPPGDPRTGDHKDPSKTLDNRRENLRIATRIEQACNRRKRSDSSTGYKGVTAFQNKNGVVYIAQIQIDGRHIYLGRRKTAKSAHEELYIPASIKYHGEFHRSE